MQLELQATWNRVRRFLGTGSLVRFLVALILAFALWAWVTSENDPETERAIPAVQVSVEGLPQSLEVVGPLPTVAIRLQGPQSRVLPLESTRIQATVDLSDVNQPGSYTRTVEVDAPEGLRVREVTPETVTVQVGASTARRAPPLAPAFAAS